MISLSHPFGNQYVRQALAALNGAALLDSFHTTVYWDSSWRVNSVLPRSVKKELSRRTYPQVHRSQVSLSPFREAGRLFSRKLGFKVPPTCFSNLAVNDALDAAVARYVERKKLQAVYAYDCVSMRTFQSAKRQGAACIYELPTAYWRHDKRLFQEEALLQPAYADTMPNRNLSAAFLDARDEEMALADHIIVPSSYVKHTLQESRVAQRDLQIIPFGTNESNSPVRATGKSNPNKLRVLFVGGLTQRKGIGYLFDAINMMGSAADLTLIGGRVGASAAVDAALRMHRWLPSIPHGQVLEEMARHDVLVLPSISEGFALVIGESLSRGLPVITTTASGGQEILRDGQDGFFVPIRSPEAIAEKLHILHRDRELLDSMSTSALRRAREFTWQRYRTNLVRTLEHILGREVSSSGPETLAT